MATAAQHNELMIEIDKKCTILFLYGSRWYSCTQISHALMVMFKSNDKTSLYWLGYLLYSKQCQQLLYTNSTVTKRAPQCYVQW